MIMSLISLRELITIFQQSTIAILLLILVNVDSHQQYPRIVHPRIISHAELTRDRRSIPLENLRNFQFVAINNWILKTQPNHYLVFSPKFSVEWSGSSSTSKFSKPFNVVKSCESREGTIHGLDEISHVLLTRCYNNFFGLLNLKNRTYLVEPLITETGEHLLYESGFSRARREIERTSSLSSSLLSLTTMIYETSKRFYNLSGDTFELENYEDNPELLIEQSDLSRNNELERSEDAFDNNNSDNLGYFFAKKRQKEKLATRKTMNKFSPPKWLEIAIAADYSVIDFHRSRVQQYILALLNIVSAIYKDRSLDSNMQLVVVRMILYTDKKDGMIYHGNARRSLENVNKWNRKLLSQLNETHDVAVWLTRLDIGGPSGYAPVSGTCDPTRSCALNRDEGLTSAFIIAHEVAHVLGLSHDGDKNSGNTCAMEAARGSIMAPMVTANFHKFHWSPCSRKEFHRKAKYWTCLLNRPSNYDSSIVKGTLEEAFDMDEQCRMEFGEGYSQCRNLESSNLCSHLWCGWANSSQACKTKKGPPLEGTLCAENKWCVNGLCKSMDQKIFDQIRLAVQDSEVSTWSSWSPWGECSRTCGIAVQYRARRCIGICDGDSKEFRICKLPTCLHPIDLRARHCSRFFVNQAGLKKNPIDNNGTWLPYESFDGKPGCQLICYKKETGEIFHTGMNVADGTSCAYGFSNICVDGVCRLMGCDGVLGSRSTRDACGQCNGNNSTCESVNAKFQRKLRRETTRLTVIPRSAYNIKVVVTIFLTEAIAYERNMKIRLRDGERKQYEISEFDIDGRAIVTIIDGVAFRVERLEEKYVLWSRGSVISEIIVSLVASRVLVQSGVSIAVSSQYTILRSELRVPKSRYVWLISGNVYSPCSATCGGGVRRKILLCRDEVTRDLVSRRKCMLTAKPIGHRQFERCNTGSCEVYTWIPGMWERCSASSCSAALGTQQRRLYCVRSTFTERQVTRENELRVYRNTVPPIKCQDQRQPQTQRRCTRVALCPAQWLHTYRQRLQKFLQPSSS